MIENLIDGNCKTKTLAWSVVQRITYFSAQLNAPPATWKWRILSVWFKSMFLFLNLFFMKRMAFLNDSLIIANYKCNGLWLASI